MVPAIAVADALRAEGAEVSFVGGERAEAELVPAAGYPLDPIRVEGISRSNPLKAARAVLKAGASLGTARSILKRRQADVVLGGGGYVAGPVGLAAVARPGPARADRGRLAHGPDQPAAGRPRPPRLPRLPARRAATATATWSPAAPSRRGPPPARRRAPPSGSTTRPSAACSSSAARSAPARSTRPRWRRSPTRPTACSTSPAAATTRTSPRPARTTTCATTSTPFGTALAAADLAVARSGGSVFELAQYGLPAVLIPYPSASADHQTTNARWMEEGGAATVLARRRAHRRAAPRGRGRDPAGSGAAGGHGRGRPRAGPPGRGRRRRARGPRSRTVVHSPTMTQGSGASGRS